MSNPLAHLEHAFDEQSSSADNTLIQFASGAWPGLQAPAGSVGTGAFNAGMQEVRLLVVSEGAHCSGRMHGASLTLFRARGRWSHRQVLCPIPTGRPACSLCGLGVLFHLPSGWAREKWSKGFSGSQLCSRLSGCLEK